MYLSFSSPESRVFYIFARSYDKFILQIAINFFINKKCHNLLRFLTPRKKTPPSTFVYFNLITPLPSISKAEHFAETFAIQLNLDNAGLVPSSPHPSDYFMLPSKDAFHVLCDLNHQKIYALMETLLLFTETVLACLQLDFSKSINSAYERLLFLHVGSVPTFSLFLETENVNILTQ